MARKQKKALKTTLLVVGEGVIDRAFIDHMKSIYTRGVNTQKVTTDAANGGSPSDIVKYVIRKNSHTAFDKKVILMDDDVPVSEAVKNQARKKNIEILYSTPICLEGMLLDVLGQSVLSSCVECKDALHSQLSGSPTQKESYAQLFGKNVLDESNNEAIQSLIRRMKNS